MSAYAVYIHLPAQCTEQFAQTTKSTPTQSKKLHFLTLPIMMICTLLNSTCSHCAVLSNDPNCYEMTRALTIHICKDHEHVLAKTSVII